MYYIAYLGSNVVAVAHQKVTCNKCKREHMLHREVLTPQKISFACHDCENVIRVNVTQEDIDRFKKFKEENG